MRKKQLKGGRPVTPAGFPARKRSQFGQKPQKAASKPWVASEGGKIVGKRSGKKNYGSY